MHIAPEKTQARIYHIHLDTKTASTELHTKIQQELGFFAHHFSGHPDGYVHFEPTSHSSIKLFSRDEFNKTWNRAVELVTTEKDVIGYLEGEFIPIDVAITFKEMVSYLPPPFRIKRRTLDQNKGEKFRETEFHLVMDFDRSNQKVINGLLDAGLYGALLAKQDHRAIVLTIQGHQRFIKPLIQTVIEYLNEVGGVQRCTIKEEVALANQLFNMPSNDLPEIIDELTYA